MRRSAHATRTMLVLVLALALLASGCFLRLSVAYVDPYGDGQLRFEAGIVDCETDITDIGSDVGCTYILNDEDGFLIEITGTAELVSDYGVFGLLIDPVVLQVPQDLSVIQGVYDRDGSIGPLVIQRTTVFDAAPGETVVAEPGQVFLILDLPPAAAADLPAGDPEQGPGFGFTLSFSVAEPRPLQVKALFTAHVIDEGRHYYPPLVPCVTDLAQVPSFEIPMAATGQDLGSALAAVARDAAGVACQNRTYTFATGPVTRLAGPDRIATAIVTSQATFGPRTAAGVVLARADEFPDALAGAPFARAQGAPILLTPTGQLDQRTAAELQRVAAPGSTVFLLGGPAALSEAVAVEVAALGYGIERIAGPNRFATAVAIAGYRSQVGGPLYLADGGTFQAALLAGNAASHDFSAVLLTDGTRMPAETRAFLDSHDDLSRIAVGPEAAASDPSAEAVAGADPAVLSVNLAERVWGSDVTTVAVASAATFPDGLTGGPHSAGRDAPLLLSEPVALSGPLRAYLESHGAVTRAFVYGGAAAISDDISQEMTGILSSRG